jgi:hypothetical protein
LSANLAVATVLVHGGFGQTDVASLREADPVLVTSASRGPCG